MSDDPALPVDGDILRELTRVAATGRIVLLAGLPAVGKSLYVQQLGLLAHRAGRTVHLLQWDVARAAFETPPYLDRYPTVEGATHRVIRRAVGLWLRKAILEWHTEKCSSDHLLIGELPIVGGRFIELVQVHDDESEELLASDRTEVIVPVPTATVRRHIEGSRAATIEVPSHIRDGEDAPPDIVTSEWELLHELGARLGFTNSQSNPPYDAKVYGSVFSRLLEHRHHKIIDIDTVIRSTGSVHDLAMQVSELEADPAEVAEIYRHIETHQTVAEIEAAVPGWSDRLFR